ncbi:hypothetical protein ACFX11_007231 [Malus domestica]
MAADVEKQTRQLVDRLRHAIETPIGFQAWETPVPGTEKKKLREKIAEELLPEKMEEWQLMDAGNPVLPWDMIVEILSWLPPKSLCRFTSVSKPWKSLVYNPNFVKFHLCLTRCDDFKIHDEFWVMKHYGIRLSWTNIKTSFRYSELYHTSFWKDSHDLLLLDCQFVMYDFNKKSFRNLSVREFLEFENAGIYMESLVSPNYYGGRDPEHEIRKNLMVGKEESSQLLWRSCFNLFFDGSRL